MLEEEDRKVLEFARKGQADREPTWRDPKWAYVFILGGVALAVLDLADGSRPGAAGGFLLGGGLLALVIQVPMSRHIWRCYRLIRRADEAKAFD